MPGYKDSPIITFPARLSRMRKLAATLAVVALLFSAGSAWAEPRNLNDGMLAYERGDNALREWLPYAEQGDTSAQTLLGRMYILGTGVPEDYVRAYMWWSLTKAQGYENTMS